MNGRVYDPKIGRFLSPDPIVQAPTNSQSWNRYTYVFNSPLNYTDPSGFEGDCFCDSASGIGDGELGGPRGGPSTVPHFIKGNPDFPYLPDGSVWLYYNSSTITAEEYQGGTNVVPTGTPVDLDEIQSEVGVEDDEELQAVIDDINETIEIIDKAETVSDIITTAGIVVDVVTGPSGEAIIIGTAAKTTANKAIKEAFERQLKEHGIKSLQRSHRKISRRLDEHVKKLEELKAKGGHTSSVEREIRTFKRQLEVIDDILNR